MSVALAHLPGTVRAAPERAAFGCVLCGARTDAPRPVLAAAGDERPFDLAACPTCALVQQHPRYEPATVCALYTDDYYVFGEAEADRWARAVQQYALHVRPLEARRGRRLLDVGCACGHFSALARARGWRTIGVDVSAEAISRARAAFGLDVRAGSLERVADGLPPFDVIFLGDVLEHVPDPVGLLRRVRAMLVPDGVVCVDTPNWASRWRRLGRSRWIGLNRFHVQFFDGATLGRAFRAAGLTHDRIGTYTHYRYATWLHRPEIQGWVDRLPAAMAWRTNRILARGRGPAVWSRLRSHPPDSLEAAVRWVADATSAEALLNGTTGDNLAARARW